MYPHYIGVTNLTNTTNSEDTITVTWNNASSPYCGEILYYMVMISSDEHCNIMNAIMNVTDLSLLTATFSNLMNDTNYNITITPYNRVIAGMSTTVSIRTSSPISTQSNNRSDTESVRNKTDGKYFISINRLMYLLTIVDMYVRSYLVINHC